MPVKRTRFRISRLTPSAVQLRLITRPLLPVGRTMTQPTFDWANTPMALPPKRQAMPIKRWFKSVIFFRCGFGRSSSQTYRNHPQLEVLVNTGKSNIGHQRYEPKLPLHLTDFDPMSVSAHAKMHDA
jgi:hypothetical protein